MFPVSRSLADEIKPPKTTASWPVSPGKRGWEEVDSQRAAGSSWKSGEVCAGTSGGTSSWGGRAELQGRPPISGPKESGQHQGPQMPDPVIFPKKAPNSEGTCKFPVFKRCLQQQADDVSPACGQPVARHSVPAFRSVKACPQHHTGQGDNRRPSVCTPRVSNRGAVLPAHKAQFTFTKCPQSETAPDPPPRGGGE